MVLAVVVACAGKPGTVGKCPWPGDEDGLKWGVGPGWNLA